MAACADLRAHMLNLSYCFHHGVLDRTVDSCNVPLERVLTLQVSPRNVTGQQAALLCDSSSLQILCQMVADAVVIQRALLQQARRRRSSSRGAPAAYSSHCPRPCLSFCRRRRPLSISSRDCGRGTAAACKDSRRTHAWGHSRCMHRQPLHAAEAPAACLVQYAVATATAVVEHLHPA